MMMIYIEKIDYDDNELIQSALYENVKGKRLDNE